MFSVSSATTDLFSLREKNEITRAERLITRSENRIAIENLV